MSDLACEVPPAYVYESNVHFGNILVSLNEQRKRGLLCDISVIVQENEFKAHKAILASCSTYFDKIITDPANVSHNIVLELSSISKIGMESLLEFAYTSKLTVNLANIDDVICAARELEFKNIEFSCLNYLKQQLLAGKSSLSFLGSQETTSFGGNSTISRQVEPCSKQHQITDGNTDKQQCSKVEKTCPSLKKNEVLSKLPFVRNKKCYEANQSDGNHHDYTKQDSCEQMSQEQHQAMIKKILEQHGLEPATVDERAMDVAATETAASCATNQRYASSGGKKSPGYLSPVYNSDTDEACSLDGELEPSLCSSKPCGKLRKQPAIKLPFTMEEITSMPRSDLHDMLTKSPNLNQEQICAIHEIRRRGKNRIAAQRCRKRKMECIKSLVAEIETLRSEHARLMTERREAREQAITLSDKFKAKCEKFFKCDKKTSLMKRFCSNATSIPAQSEQQVTMPLREAEAHNFQEHAQRAHQLCQKLKEAPAEDLPPCPLLTGDSNMWSKSNDGEEVICTVIDDGLESNYQACSPSSPYVMSPSQGLRNDFGNIHISPTLENNSSTITQARTTVLQHTNASRTTLPPFSSLVMPVTTVLPNVGHLSQADGRDATMTDLSDVQQSAP